MSKNPPLRRYCIMPNSRLEGCLKIFNFLTCMMYPALSIVLAIQIHKVFYKGGKMLREAFQPGPFLTHMSILIPIWNHIPDALPFAGWLDSIYTACIIMCFMWALVFLDSLSIMANGKRMECITFVCLIIITLLAELLIAWQLSGVNQVLILDAMDAAVSELKNFYGVLRQDLVTVTVNTFMLMGQCCGLKGYKDFKKVILDVRLMEGQAPYKKVLLKPDSPEWLQHLSLPVSFMNFTTQESFRMPPACCKSDIITEKDNIKQFYDIVKCAESEPDESIHNLKGCFVKLHEEFLETGYAQAFALVILMVQSIQVIVSLILFWHLKPRPKIGNRQGRVKESESGTEMSGSTPDTSADA